jgi:hypothetical protein
MVSAYHLDGEDLLLTHYCIANNQPTLRAQGVCGALCNSCYNQPRRSSSS